LALLGRLILESEYPRLDAEASAAEVHERFAVSGRATTEADAVVEEDKVGLRYGRDSGKSQAYDSGRNTT
jgi:hypothetical protein